MLSGLKRLVLGRGKCARRIRSGLIHGITMDLDPEYQTQLILGIAERELQHWIKRLATGVKTAVDAGTSEGSYFLWFLLRSDAKHVLGFEPDAALRSQLWRNVELNVIPPGKTFDLHPSFVGAAQGTSTVTMDDFLEIVEFPAILKIDVEGAEADVLRGARCILQNDARLVIEVHSDDQQAQCRTILTQAGFRIEAVHSAWWRGVIPEVRPATHHLKTKWLVAWKE